MLHFENRKGRAQSYGALTFIAAFLVLLTVACNRQQNSLSQQQKEAQEAAQKEIDELAFNDSLISYLHQHVDAIGFDGKAFLLDSIDMQQSMISQKKVSGDSLQIVKEMLNKNLRQAYMTYAEGVRYGFMNPEEVFSSGNYDVKVEHPDSTFNAEAQKAFDEMKACEFLRKCEPTSKAYQTLLQSYQNDSTINGKKRAAMNLERLRWRDKKAPADSQRYVFVNIAAQQVWAIGKDSVLSMRICCGKPSTKTPLLTSAIHLIEVNPEWNIPVSIIRGEVSHRAGDSAYFARHNYYITDRTGKRVNPKELSSSQLASGGYRVAQRSGAGNSLGRIIFRFNNRFSVYLHDTSNKSAFNAETRTISHGCVRVQRPYDMAKFLLTDADHWLLDRIRLSMDLEPEYQEGRDYVKSHGARGHRLISSTEVTPNVPVVISYFTLYPNPETGVVETWPDRYSYDTMIEKALKPFLK